MEGRVRCRRGGIRGLCRLLGEHGEALEYDLITLGVRRDCLGTEHLTWRDLYVIVKHLPDTSALRREVLGDGAVWDVKAHLLAGIVDLLAAANWQRGGDEHAKKPERIERPGVTNQPQGETMARGKPVTIEEMNALLGWESNP